MGCYKLSYHHNSSDLHQNHNSPLQVVSKNFGIPEFPPSTYSFGFNGKEQDNEVAGTGNQYDYGFRIYNPRIAKFLSVDPLTSSYPWYTPYQFAGNKPIWKIDLDGLEEGNSGANSAKPYYHNRDYDDVKWDARDRVGLRPYSDPRGLNLSDPYDQEVLNESAKQAKKNRGFWKATSNLIFDIIPTSVPGMSSGAVLLIKSYLRRKAAREITEEVVEESLQKVAPKVAQDPVMEASEQTAKGVKVKLNGQDVPVYRGGTDFTLKPGEFRVTPNGKYPARGLSLNADASKVANYGGAKKITSIPDGLEIIHTPSKANPQHFDLIPTDRTITQEQFQSLLNQIKVE